MLQWNFSSQPCDMNSDAENFLFLVEVYLTARSEKKKYFQIQICNAKPIKLAERLMASSGITCSFCLCFFKCVTHVYQHLR